MKLLHIQFFRNRIWILCYIRGRDNGKVEFEGSSWTKATSTFHILLYLSNSLLSTFIIFIFHTRKENIRSEVEMSTMPLIYICLQNLIKVTKILYFPHNTFCICFIRLRYYWMWLEVYQDNEKEICVLNYTTLPWLNLVGSFPYIYSSICSCTTTPVLDVALIEWKLNLLNQLWVLFIYIINNGATINMQNKN